MEIENSLQFSLIKLYKKRNTLITNYWKSLLLSSTTSSHLVYPPLSLSLEGWTYSTPHHTSTYDPPLCLDPPPAAHWRASPGRFAGLQSSWSRLISRPRHPPPSPWVTSTSTLGSWRPSETCTGRAGSEACGKAPPPPSPGYVSLMSDLRSWSLICLGIGSAAQLVTYG